MRIGIDARMYGSNQGGLGRYIEQLILHLEKLHQGAEFIIFLNKANWYAYEPSEPHFTKVLADIPWYGLEEQLQLPKIIAANNIDLMHFPHWNVPLLYRGKFIVTIHDLILLHYPTQRASTRSWFTYALKNIAFRFVLRHAAKKSIHIIAPSEFTKQDIVKTLDVRIDKITVTYLAPQPAAQIKNPHHPKEPYVLYVGVAYPHKNLERLLLAWKRLHTKLPNFSLVLAGKKNYFYERLEVFTQANSIPNVRFAGYVPDSELPELYAGATLSVLPSLYEGFGLPPLEALQYGTPVACANSSCLPEILGAAAIYFDPLDERAITTALEQGLTDKNKRDFVLREAKNTLSRYNWEITAKQTSSLYKNSV